MQGFQIQKATVGDLNELIVLEQLAFEQESFSRRQLRYLLTKAKADCALIRIDGKLAASIILIRKSNSHYLRIYSILVSPDHRGLGLAKSLLQYAEERAADYQLKGLSLEVSEDNEPAVALYLKWGFQTISEKKKYYKDGSSALVMRKEIGCWFLGQISF